MKRMIWCAVLMAATLRGAQHYANTFGRTHFIVGMPLEEYDRYRDGFATIGSEPQEVNVRGIHKILFAPDDDIHSELLRLIEDETSSIKIAMYFFTDKEIAQALREAQQRGVSIECVTDASCISNKFNKMDELAQCEIPVWVYRAANESKSLGNIMHHKFMIFETLGKVVTGSLNVTGSAQRNNQENIVILCDGRSVREFDKQFGRLKTRCSRLMPIKSVQEDK